MESKKVALITGANKGLGFEIARQLGERGIAVVVGARDLGKARSAMHRLKDKQIEAEAVQLDVTSREDIAAVPAFFRGRFGQLDILVNNAGVAFGSPQETSLDDMRKTFETNLFGAYAVTTAVLPFLKASSSGRVVNQSSILGSLFTVSSGQAGDWILPAYCSSKAALNMLTVVTAQLLEGTRVKVNAAHPGWVRTDMGGSNAPMSVEEGARTAVELALLPDDGPSGLFFHLGKQLRW
jgi:NAD(P)-dependent dehydrogenase (short-subunit alcohol dehydrogenase family)